MIASVALCPAPDWWNPQTDWPWQTLWKLCVDFDGFDGWLVEEKHRRQRQKQTAENTQSVQLSIRVFVGIQHQPQMFMKNIEKVSNNSNHGKCKSSLCAFHCSLVVASHCFRCEGHFGFFSPSPALRLCRLPGVLQCKALHKFRASCQISIVWNAS